VSPSTESPTSERTSSSPDVLTNDRSLLAESQRSTADDVRSGLARADVVVVAYETPHALERCLRSLTDGSVVGDRIGRIVVVDNSISTECEVVVARHPQVGLIRPDSNLGFGRGANAGVAATRDGAAHVFVLNADTEVMPGAVGALIDHLVAHPTAALAGPSLTDRAGRVQPSCGTYPTPLRVVLMQTGLWRPLARALPRRRFEPFTNPASSGPVPWVLGAAMMIDRRAIEEVGGFDPGFHMYFEEVDLARRLARRRRETHFVPQAVVRHAGGESTAHDPGAAQRQMYASLARHMRLHGRSARVTRLRLAVATVVVAHILRSVGSPAAASPWRTILADSRRGWDQ
jgi:N-acetylglucosaminyl-diphospho-decaprenol L-rhamnosyltransferase